MLGTSFPIARERVRAAGELVEQAMRVARHARRSLFEIQMSAVGSDAVLYGGV